MALSPTEAADALREIDHAERRSFSAYGYKSAAPHLILWGLVWFIGYGGTYLFPPYTNWIWLAVVATGVVTSTLMGMATKPAGSRKFSWRIFFTWLAAFALISSVLSIFYPFSGMQVGSLFPLVIGWAYVILGIWMGSRFAIAGLLVVALTLFGFFELPPATFLLWMAFLGAAILVGTGVWLRRA